MDKEILSATEVGRLFDLDPQTVADLLEDGSLPGRKIAGRWYVSHRQLVDFIEEGTTPNRSFMTHQSPPLYSQPRVNALDNSWECAACRKRNPVERVVCAVCKRPRSVALMSYKPQ